jgi:hypothetical protein
MRVMNFKISWPVLLLICITAGVALAGQTAQEKSSDDVVNKILDRMIDRELALVGKMRELHPLVETYLQNLDSDDELAFHPVSDQYFIGKLDLNTQAKERLLRKNGSVAGKITGTIAQLYSGQYLPGGFAQMLVVDSKFDKKNYQFEYVRREFLGDVRTIVFDVLPRKGSQGTFEGRIWVEDHDYNIVRFNGTYNASGPSNTFFHFDSWREYMGPGQWLPAYVYIEEPRKAYLSGARHLRFKGQTRLWGYSVAKPSTQDELTSLTVESDEVKDKADDAEFNSPVNALRAWERQAEENLIQRLEKGALLAPEGSVNKVLETVITNLEVTNNLDIQPEVRARVLLTSPLESFTIGHTIVLSRGLIDVLPDEASLAMILAHELAHIALGHRLDTMYAFNDRMMFEDPEAFQKVQLRRPEKEEAEADAKAVEFLKKSPYGDKLGNAALFLEAVDARASKLSNLLLPHIGNTIGKNSQTQRMAAIREGAPKLDMTKVDQIAALPLGGRVRVDPWSAKIELLKSKPVALLSAREKMPFEVTPFYLHLTRPTGETIDKTTAASAQASEQGAKVE